MMKKISLIISFLAVYITASAQYDSSRVRQLNNSYGFDFNNLKAKHSLIIPNDTPRLAMKDSGAIASLSGRMFSWNGKSWGGVFPGGGEGNVVNIETANSIYEIQGSEDVIYINRSGVQVKFPDPVLFPGKKIVIGTRSFPYIGDVFFSGTYLPKGYDLIGNSLVFTSQSVAQITDYVSDGTEWRATRQSYLTEVKNTVLGTGEGIATNQTIYKNNGVAQYNLKRLKAGNGITVTKDGDNDILISATGSGSTTLQQVDSAVNTLRPIAVKYADTTAMLSPYLRKIDTTGKWKSASYIPTWSEITGKPTLLTRSDFSATAPLTYNSGTGQYSITKANGSTDGYLSKEDWSTFNGKVSSPWVKSGDSISYNNGVVNIGDGSKNLSLNVTGNITTSQSNTSVLRIAGYSPGFSIKDMSTNKEVYFRNIGSVVRFGESTGTSLSAVWVAGPGVAGYFQTNGLLKMKGGATIEGNNVSSSPDSILVIEKNNREVKTYPNTFAQQQSLTDSIQILRDSINQLRATLSQKDTINAALPLQVAVDENDKQTLQINWDKLEDSLLAKGWVKSGGGSGLPTTGYNKGDIFYANSSGNIVALPKGTNGQVLELDGDIPAWKNKDSGTMPDLSDRDFANDSIAVVDGGLAVGDWYRTGGNVKYLTTMPVLEDTAFYMQFVVNKVGDDDSLAFRVMGSSNSAISMTVDWGDGSAPETGTDISTYLGHKYASAGSYKVRITNVNYTDIRNFQLLNVPAASRNLVDIKNIQKLSRLDTWVMSNVSFGAFFDTLQIASTPTTIQFSSGKFIDNTFPQNINLGAVIVLNLVDSDIKSWSRALPNSLSSFNLSSADLSVTEINNILVWFNGQTFSAGSRTINLSTGKGRQPTGDGLTAKSDLEGKGWTVIVDP